ncbi:cytochrome P450 [Dendryphion nanum]|uniref:Cytochrome P450 n=1 Tax=Dendryphion nanum TaxID=256645 RepID=A0A9P9DZ93_9PLEO|nr:cytochrome P450 [Dendryphion nanum]
MAGSRFQVIACVGGILSEALIFCRGEWDIRSAKIARTYLAIQLASVGLLVASGTSVVTSVFQVAGLTISYLIGLYGSMIAYRLFFHPLRSFPGPLGARVSALWILKQNIPGLTFYRKVPKLHEKYGDFVRTRPRELSICHPDAVIDIHGPRSKVRKGEFYDQQYPYHTLQMTRDPVIHRDKRRIWDKAFSMKALQEYEPRVLEHYQKFFHILTEHSEARTPVNIQHLLEGLGFDISSDLTFGESWNMLGTGEVAPVLKEFIDYKKTVGYVLMLNWIFHSFKILPGIEERIFHWVNEYSKSLEKRGKMTSISADFYTHLSRADNFDKDGPFDAQLAIIAGSDTVSFTMTNIMYVFATRPEWQTKLRAELGFTDSSNAQDKISDQELAANQFLGGFINEVLRFWPAIPSGLQRLTPPEGATIAGRFVPGNINVVIPTYSLHRDERAFLRPKELIPERWFSKPELILRKDSFLPFGYGPYNCTGRPFAYLQLRLLTAMILQRYDISIPAGKETDIQRYEQEQADCFVMHLQPLPLLFTQRK